MKHKRIYALIKRAGHSPVKAAEIVLDAERGSKYSIDWIMSIFFWRHNL